MRVGGHLKPEAELRRLLDQGILRIIGEADSANHLLIYTSENAVAINAAGFGRFAHTLQDALVRQFVLSLTKLFEDERGYDLQSFPAIRRYLDENGCELALADKAYLVRTLKLTGHDIEPESEDLLVTAELLKYIDRRMPRKDKPDLWAIMEPLKMHRDKVIAHNELIDKGDLLRVTWGEARRLLAIGKELAHLIGRGYLNYHLMVGDEFTTEKTASLTTSGFRRLLRKAGVIQ